MARNGDGWATHEELQEVARHIRTRGSNSTGQGKKLTPAKRHLTITATETQAQLWALAEMHDAQDKLPGWIADGCQVASPRVQQDIVQVHQDRATNRPWDSVGEQLLAIAAHYTGQGNDPRLYAAASGGNANVGGDGGFAIARDFAVDLMTGAIAGSVLARRCSEYPIGNRTDTLEIAVFDESSRVTGSRFGGVQVFRAAEAETVTAKRPKLGKWEAQLQDLTGLAYVTERLAQDAAAVGLAFDEAFREETAWTLDNEIYVGTGAGQCLGVTNAPARIEVPKETGQLADTIVAENVSKVWRRVPAGSKLRGIWTFTPEAEDQLAALAVGTGSSHIVKYAAPGQTDADHYLTIHGRPAYPLEQAPGVGDVGDLSFLDLSRYGLVRKGTANRQESVHVRFLHNERVWKWTTRVNGAPKIARALTPAKGTSTNTVSPFVMLAQRA